MSAYSCDEHRVEAPERLAGELSTLGQERFDRHQRTCAACRAFLASLAGALAAARAEPEDLSLAEVDAAYGALMTRLDGSLEVRPEEPRVAAGVAASRAARRWWPVAVVATVVAAAAAIAIVLGGPGDAGDVPEAASWVALSPEPGLELRVASGTELDFDEPRDGTTTLVLRAGTVYARVAPLPPGRAFVVRAPDLSVRVIGTVFMVRAAPGHPTEVAVMRGAVGIERPGTAPVTLLAGQSWRAPGPTALVAEADLGVVRDWLLGPPDHPSAASAPLPPATGAPATAAVASAPPVAAPAAVRPPAPVPTYAEAERALVDRGPAAAAVLLERLVAGRPEATDADTARLELGRLYAGSLARPADARRHLRTFLARNPSGAGAATAGALLCSIDPHEPACTKDAPAGD